MIYAALNSSQGDPSKDTPTKFIILVVSKLKVVAMRTDRAMI